MEYIRRYLAWRKKRKAYLKERAIRRGPVIEFLDLVLSVTISVFLIRTIVVEAYRIPSGSMEKTLLIGDFLLVNKFLYGVRTPDWIGVPFTELGFDLPVFRFPSFDEPDRGDIIVFKYPNDTDINFIKRCIAVPGDTVVIHDKQVFVNGDIQENPPDYQINNNMRLLPAGFNDPRIKPPGSGNKDNYGPIIVPEDAYFMMGDNRDNSEDSRFWGFLPRDLIVGKAWMIYFSWSNNRHSPWLIHKKIRFGRIFDFIH